MSVLFIRKPSETPNIQNIDDIRMVRYAYGNQNGYIKGYGAELSHNATGSTFLINSGIFVVQGAEVKIDANGWSESVSGVTNKRYYTVYGEVNLALQTAEIKSTYNHAMYPTIEAGDDLTQATDGTAREVLYRFTATNSIIADVQKVIKEISYSIDMINPLTTTVTQLSNDVSVLKTKRTLIFDSIASSNNATTWVTLFTHSTSLINKRLLIEYKYDSRASVSRIVKLTGVSSLGLNLESSFGPATLNSDVQFLGAIKSIRLSDSNTLQGYGEGTFYKIIDNQMTSVGNQSLSLEIHKIWIIGD